MTTEHWLGLVTGMFFGLLLQQGRVLRFEKQINAMLLRDMTIFKFMLSAVLVGMIGITLLVQMGQISYNHKALNLGGLLLGGTIFGVGWAIAGFCPGTAVGAIAEGRWHALFAILGMLLGAAIFAEIYPTLQSTVLAWKDLGKVGLPELMGISPWPVVAVFALVSLGAFYLFEKLGV
ncbi:MAG: YeeE/YedE family protein [Thermoguttaceae bacterium]|nr:YeeE/YedE family protein [Thermoguttaceae bacterium]MDW8037663.1 YeeE/YedE thiosulfate transporter family protein [Thermoguttaceae bacterium]